jgi:hypothetical protein
MQRGAVMERRITWLAVKSIAVNLRNTRLFGRRFDGQDGTGRFSHHMLSDAAHEKPAKSRPTVTANDNDVGAHLLGAIDDHTGGLALYEARLYRNVVDSGSQGSYGIQLRL